MSDASSRAPSADPAALGLSAGAVTAAHRAFDLAQAAVVAGDVFLAFQPVVASAGTRAMFWEGLARIREPGGRVVPAREFIDAVEVTETGRHLDCLTLAAGLRALAAAPDLRLSINLSARSIGHDGWLETLDRALADNPGLAARLVLEITEASAIGMLDRVRRFMLDLKDRGVDFALDDFGAGYSSFRHLRDLPFDIVKIDGGFVRGIDAAAENQILAGALISVSAQFGKVTVAEHVTTEAEAAWLAEAGVDGLQGHHLGAATLAPPWSQAPATAF